jgi:hypothetical protein
MEKKLTKMENYEKAVALAEKNGDNELVKFFKHEMELLEKRKISGKKSEKNTENEEYKELILDILETADKPMTITDIMKADSNLPQSNQKISSLVRQLKEENVVTRTEVKGRAYFALAND